METSLANASSVAVTQLTDGERTVIGAILASPGNAASAIQLKLLLGLKHIVNANSAIGNFGRRVFSLLGAHPDGRGDNFQKWTVVATGTKSPTLGWIWKLRPDVVVGLQAAGLTSNSFSLPDEAAVDVLTEGAYSVALVSAYERNTIARQRCIETHGTDCSVCGFSFGRTYGEKAVGYIHVHHLVPLSSRNGEYTVDPVEDLRPLCPNCHAFVHITNPPLTLEEARAAIALNTPSERSHKP